MGPRGSLIVTIAACAGVAACAGNPPPATTPVAGSGNKVSAPVAVAPSPPREPIAEPARPDPKLALAARVVADFEQAVLAAQDAYVALFDFAAVGEYEILLHRYDLNGRMPQLPAALRAQFAKEDGTPYPAARERRNVTSFYKPLAQRTIGSGGCAARPPRSRYGRQLGETFEPLPPGTPPRYEVLRTHANAWLAKGGVVGFTCSGGTGGLAVVYTITDSPRGYDLITIYDD